MKCIRCSVRSNYPICRACANVEESKILDRIDEIDRLIQDSRYEIQNIKKTKGIKSKRLTWGIVLTCISVALIWIGDINIWYSIIGFFILVFGLGILIVGMLDVFPDKLAKMDFYDEQNQWINKLKREKQSIIRSLREGEK